MLFNGLDYRIGYKEWLYLDHLQGFFGIASEQIIQDEIILHNISSSARILKCFFYMNK